MTAYIVTATDDEEYWVPFAVSDDEDTAEAIMDAASQHVIAKLRAKHGEAEKDDPGGVPPFDEEAAADTAAMMVSISHSKPPFVPGGSMADGVLPEDVVNELNRQIDEYSLLELV